MSCHYVLDESAGRVHKTAYSDPKQAIEKAAESARCYNRAISVWEVDNERESDPGTVADAKQLHCIVYPDGKTRKPKKGVNPYVEYFENADAKEPGPNGGAERDVSLEEFLKLPGTVLGRVISQLDEATTQLDDCPQRTRIHAIADVFCKEMERRVEINRKLVLAFKVGDSFVDRQARQYTVAQADHKNGLVNEMDAVEWSKMLLKAGAVRVQAAPPEKAAPESPATEAPADEGELEPMADQESAAPAPRLQPGQLATVDDHDDAYVLDAADGVFVVLMNDSITTMPDDPIRLRRPDVKNDPVAAKKQRIFGLFFKQLLSMRGVASVDELDGSGKTSFFDMARAKWPKLRAKLLEQAAPPEPPPAPGHSAPAPKEAPKESAPEASLLAYLTDSMDNDLEAAAKLAANLATAVNGRDPTKLRALKTMSSMHGHALPAGWFDVATAKLRAGRVARAGVTVSLLPPPELGAVARACLAQHAGDLPDLTLRVCRALASAKAIDLQVAESMLLFHSRFASTDVTEPVFAAFGGQLGACWIRHIAPRCRL